MLIRLGWEDFKFFLIIYTVYVFIGVYCNILYMLMVWKLISFSGNFVFSSFMIKF